MDKVQSALVDFLSQPWGMVGAVCIMLAVTCFNSRLLRARFEALGLGEAATATLLNGLNLLGGACLLINAVIRREIVWEVLEVYFVIVAAKGLAQARRTPEAEPAAPAPATP